MRFGKKTISRQILIPFKGISLRTLLLMQKAFLGALRFLNREYKSTE
jgi:hypothetical protein